MASDWKSSLTASARYENIERLAVAIGALDSSQNAHQEATKIESEAYNSSVTREEYNEACSPSPQPAPQQEQQEDENEQTEPQSPGIQLGPYPNCHPIASGLTSTVYRSSSSNFALKLIHTVAPPHNPRLEAKILRLLNHDSTPNVIALLDTFTDQGHPILVFPYMPLTLADLLEKGPLPTEQTRRIFLDILGALKSIHEKGILHRDIKPSAILLPSPSPSPTTPAAPAQLSDFGTAWHPTLSPTTAHEPPDAKILDIGTGPYRPPEALFGNASYSTPSDMWSLGVLLSECASTSKPPKPIFESPPTHEDGSQLGLILSVFQTLGTPTPETWPEAGGFRTKPFEMWRVFPRRSDEEVFGGVMEEFRGAVMGLLRYESSERLTASQLLDHESLRST